MVVMRIQYWFLTQKVMRHDEAPSEDEVETANLSWHHGKEA
jgi:hypothetical protein